MPTRPPKLYGEKRKRTPRPRKEWNLVCITKKGKVSFVRDLDLYTARETYKRLLPDKHPETHVFPDCKECGKYGWSWGGMTYAGRDDSDRLQRVEAIGPPGKELDPWHGVEPRIVDMSYLCQCDKSKKVVDGITYHVNGGASTDDQSEPEWDSARKDFWNNPKLWDHVKDPKTELCWMDSPKVTRPRRKPAGSKPARV